MLSYHQRHMAPLSSSTAGVQMDGDGFVDLNARLLDKSLHQDDRNKSGVRVDGRNLPPFIVPQQGRQQAAGHIAGGREGLRRISALCGWRAVGGGSRRAGDRHCGQST